MIKHFCPSVDCGDELHISTAPYKWNWRLTNNKYATQKNKEKEASLRFPDERVQLNGLLISFRSHHRLENFVPHEYWVQKLVYARVSSSKTSSRFEVRPCSGVIAGEFTGVCHGPVLY